MKSGKLLCIVLSITLFLSGCSENSIEIGQESSSDSENEYNPLRLSDIEPESGNPNYVIMFTQALEQPVLEDIDLPPNLMDIHMDRYTVQYIQTEQVQYEYDVLGFGRDSYFSDISSLNHQLKIYEVYDVETGESVNQIKILIFPTIKQAQGYWFYRQFSAEFTFKANYPAFRVACHEGIGDVGIRSFFVRSNVVVHVNSVESNLPELIDEQILNALYPSDLEIIAPDLDDKSLTGQDSQPPDVDVLFDHVFGDMLQYENVWVTFTSEYATVRESEYAFLSGSEHLIVDLKVGIKIDNGNGLGGRISTYSLIDDTQYTGVFPYGDAAWLSNKVIAVVGGYQTSDYDTSEKVLLLDKYCEPLPNQLQFDYGINLANLDIQYETIISDVGDQYRIFGLVYHSGLSQYIAVYHTNAFWNTQDGRADNSVCTVGIAIFDDSGLQLERKDLDGVVYPHVGKRERLYIPQAFLISDTEILLITSGTEVDMLCIDFHNGTASTWTDEDMLAFLEESSQFVGEQNPSGSWQLSESRPEAPFYIDSKGLLHIDAIDTPAFAVPEKYSLLEWGMEESGAYFAIFRAKTD